MTWQSPRGRMTLLVVLTGGGLAYFAAFAWFKLNSVDFIERDRDMIAVLAAHAISKEEFAWTFESGSSAVAMLGSGWRLPDTEATWSEGDGGVVFLPSHVAAGSRLEVRFDGHLNSSDQEMTVILLANGQPIGDWRLTQKNRQIVERVTLPTRDNDTVPWRLRFVVERPGHLLWRGNPAGLLAYGIHLRGLRTVEGDSKGHPYIK